MLLSLRSNPQTMSSYIHESDSLCTRTDHPGGGGLATNCVSCCSCVVRAARVELMLLSETFCLSVSSWR